MKSKMAQKKCNILEFTNSCPSKHCICTPANANLCPSQQAMNLYSRTNFNMGFAPHAPKTNKNFKLKGIENYE